MRTQVAVLCVLSVVAAISTRAPLAAASNRVHAGEFSIDPATLINLGFEWVIEGDDNRNATVDVSDRKRGETRWKRAQPMLRLQGERIFNGDQLEVVAPNMFAGSVLDLDPDTEYEAEFVMADPDGAEGTTTRVVTGKTRPEPMPAPDGRTFHVYPPGFRGTKIQPAFDGLMCAYNLTCAGID